MLFLEQNFFHDEQDIGPAINIKFTSTSALFLFAIKPTIDDSTVTSGWKVMLDSINTKKYMHYPVYVHINQSCWLCECTGE